MEEREGEALLTHAYARIMELEEECERLKERVKVLEAPAVPMQEYVGLLGKEVRDAQTGCEGVVASVTCEVHVRAALRSTKGESMWWWVEVGRLKEIKRRVRG